VRGENVRGVPVLIASWASFGQGRAPVLRTGWRASIDGKKKPSGRGTANLYKILSLAGRRDFSGANGNSAGRDAKRPAKPQGLADARNTGCEGFQRPLG